MPNFNFDALSPQDFEELVRDLLQADWNVTLEAFKEGRDDGIDLRYAPANDGTTIVQCKRYGKSGYAKLLANLRETERPKIERLRPGRYVVATIIGLTPGNKDKIVEALRPFVLNTGDVLGANDLEGLLSRYPQIARANFKLWLTNTTVLERVLHNAELCQTDFEVERVHRKLPLFVQNGAFPRARELLDQTRIAIISGPPGIGKTTLAEMLLYAQLEEGYEPVVIQGEVSEGKKLFNARKKQIFYYDDFLGQIFLGDRPEYLGKNEDAAIFDFMEMIRASDYGRFVLTTREHILSGALQASERLKHSPMLQHHCILTLGDYTLGHRARILYNHLYFSDLSETYKEAVLHGDFFLNIIKHEHFSPRLIEWLASRARLRNVLPEAYRAHITQLLDSPESIWSFAYLNQISDAARHVLLCLYALGERTNAIDLEPAFLDFHRANSVKYSLKIAPGDFRRALQELEGSFLAYSSGVVRFLNPSIREFIASLICSEREIVQDLLGAAIRFKQAANLWSLLIGRPNEVTASILSSDVQLFYASFLRLLNGPPLRWGKNNAGRLEGHYIDIDAEGRVVFLMELAERQKDAQSAALAITAIDVLVNGWEQRPLSFYFVLDAIERFSGNPWFLENGGRAAYRRILDGMLKRLTSARATDWIKLVALHANAVDWKESDEAQLTSGLKNYQESGVYDELSDCVDLEELNELKVSLETLTENKITGFAVVIQRLDEGITEKEAEREQLSEDKGYSSRMTTPVTASLSDDDVRQMFATLIEQ
jgi:hypothetical protein